MTEQHPPTEPINDELARHLDWSFWGTGMADTFRDPLAEAMLAGITPEQREHANALITRWRDHREFVGRDKYEAQRAEIDRLTAELEQARAAAFHEAASAVMEGSHGEPMRDAYNAHMRDYGLLRRLAREAAPACACGAEPVHQNGCEDGA